MRIMNDTKREIKTYQHEAAEKPLRVAYRVVAEALLIQEIL